MKNILFVANVKVPSDKMNSTDIMTQGIIRGLSENDVQLSLLLLVDGVSEAEELRRFYGRYTSRIFILPRFFREGQSKYHFLFGGLRALSFPRRYKKELKRILSALPTPDVIVANKVTLDEIVYANLLKKAFRGAQYYQYWSDPMALSGINLELFRKTPRRYLFKYMEGRALAKCDKIVYGTATLCMMQSRFFPRLKGKMTYIDVAYAEDCSQLPCADRNKLLYAGNYHQTIRDLSPLVEAVSEQGEVTLDIYGNGDLDVSGKQNVTAHGRISREELCRVEGKYGTEVCVMNKATPQIPGKIFYGMCTQKNILVLTDGPASALLVAYLKKYKRFAICKNEKEEIKKCLASLEKVEVDLSYLRENFSPRAVAKALIDGGFFLDESYAQV